MTIEDFVKSKVNDFYTKFTDGCDEKNNYYDSQFEDAHPYQVAKYIKEILYEALTMTLGD